MKNNEIAKLRKDILEGMKVSSAKLKAMKKQLGHSMVISENGIITEIKPQNLK